MANGQIAECCDRLSSQDVATACFVCGWLLFLTVICHLTQRHISCLSCTVLFGGETFGRAHTNFTLRRRRADFGQAFQFPGESFLNGS